MKTIILAFAFCAVCISNPPVPEQNNSLIRFGISKVWNARPIAAIANKKPISRTEGIDGDGVAAGCVSPHIWCFGRRQG